MSAQEIAINMHEIRAQSIASDGRINPFDDEEFCKGFDEWNAEFNKKEEEN